MLKRWEELPEFMRTPEVRLYWEILNKKRGQLALKRMFDYVVALIFLIILVIPMGVIAITLVNKPRQIMQSVLYYRHGYDTSFEGFTGNQEDHQGADHSPA